MVTHVTNLGRSGLSDWLIQRLSAVVIAAYALFLLSYLIITPVTFSVWTELFQQTWMRIFTVLFILSLVAHAWIGLWTIATDYINSVTVRFLFLMACLAVLFICVVWGIEITWSIGRD